MGCELKIFCNPIPFLTYLLKSFVDEALNECRFSDPGVPDYNHCQFDFRGLFDEGPFGRTLQVTLRGHHCPAKGDVTGLSNGGGPLATSSSAEEKRLGGEYRWHSVLRHQSFLLLLCLLKN